MIHSIGFSGTGLLFANGNCCCIGIYWNLVCTARLTYSLTFRIIDYGDLDYRETALHLQKEWNKQDPQQLPFADHVETHALVSTLNKGLLYGLERGDTAKVCTPHCTFVTIDHIQPVSSQLTFGSDSARWYAGSVWPFRAFDAIITAGT